MRVYVSVDMEGIAGVVHESQTDPTTPAFGAEYARFRRLMTAEANAAIEGALAAGATKVLVNDSHWFMRNLLAEELHPAADLASGDPKPRSMVQGIDGGFDAALFIGYHARAGTPNAILDHTYADRIPDVRLNGTAVGELGVNPALAGGPDGRFHASGLRGGLPRVAGDAQSVGRGVRSRRGLQRSQPVSADRA